ncbi:MAG: glycosyltransferase family 4 protein [Candidatus Aminicenantes bacterium]|nr:MAG: glycosyltransferase family 4 protein [Candidatus Aminicenantes bacterium]
MNILFISSLYPSTTDADARGITFALHSLVKYWNQEGKVIVVRPVYLYLRELLAPKPGQQVKKTFKREMISLDGVRVIVFPIFKIPRIAYFYYPLYRYLNKYLKSIGFVPDVVVAHYDKSLHIGYRYSRKRKLPYAAGLHITPDLVDDNPAHFSKRCGKLLEAAAVIACRSGYIYNKVLKWFPGYQEKSFIAFSGIEENLIEEPGVGIKRMKQWKTRGKVSIISVCSLIERKKIDTNLRALARLKDKPDWTYTIIGDGEERGRLEALASQLGIKGRVRFKGLMSREEVIQEMKQSHIFVLVSYLETFGLVYLEAMAVGCIVIGAKGEGIDGVIEDQKNGFLSPAGEVEPLKDVLETIILRLPEDKLENILMNSHQTIIRYTDKKAAKSYWQHLEDIIGS